VKLLIVLLFITQTAFGDDMSKTRINDGNGREVGFQQDHGDKITVWRVHNSNVGNGSGKIIGDWYPKLGYGMKSGSGRVGNIGELIAECYR
jgi:hypothetical protein